MSKDVEMTNFDDEKALNQIVVSENKLCIQILNVLFLIFLSNRKKNRMG